MRYTLILKTGKIMVFYVKTVAELYRDINDGSTLIMNFLENKVYEHAN